MKPNLKYVLLVFISGILVLLSYQNCSKNGFEALNSADSSIHSSSQGTTTTTLAGGATTTTTLGSANGFIDPASAGQIDANCLAASSPYDACIFLKNPVAQKGSALSSFPAYQSAELTGLQTFGVHLTNLTSPARLQSSSLDVYYSGPNYANQFRTPLVGGKFKQAYSNDGVATSASNNEKSTAQLMAYFWLNYQGSELLRRTGVNWSSGKSTLVDAYSNDAANLGTGIQTNAYFTYSSDAADTIVDKRYIVMGYAQPPGATTNTHEMALSADVYSHEMGHGNILAAAGTQINHDYDNDRWIVQVNTCTNTPSRVGNVMVMNQAQIDTLRASCTTEAGYQNPGSNDGLTNFQIDRLGSFCKNHMGCIDAINEGQADFHYLMMFPFKTPLGETIGNSVSGASAFNFKAINAQTATIGGCDTVTAHAGVPRDVAQMASSWTIDDFFLGSALQMTNCTIQGEIHGMGSLYAKILWDIYSNTSTDKRAFERTFQRHLSHLTHSDNFSSAKSALLADDLANESSKNRSIISSVFTAKGVP